MKFTPQSMALCSAASDSRIVHRAPRPADRPRAEADVRNLPAGPAELAIVHHYSLLRGPLQHDKQQDISAVGAPVSRAALARASRLSAQCFISPRLRGCVMKLMESAGMKPRIDAAGNIMERRERS